MADVDRISRAVRVLATGRAPGLAIAFAIPLVLARTFDQAEFGTYKQLFLIYATLFGIAQLGMAESLYYFVPRETPAAGRHAANALIALAAIGLACVLLLFAFRSQIAEWLSNPGLAPHLVPLGWFLALTLIAAVFEIVLISRRRPAAAAWTYALSDIGRAACFVIPAALAFGLRGVMAGAVDVDARRGVVVNEPYVLQHDTFRGSPLGEAETAIIHIQPTPALGLLTAFNHPRGFPARAGKNDHQGKPLLVLR